jgi:hypothetical protein
MPRRHNAGEELVVVGVLLEEDEERNDGIQMLVNEGLKILLRL